MKEGNWFDQGQGHDSVTMSKLGAICERKITCLQLGQTHPDKINTVTTAVARTVSDTTTLKNLI